jgi:tetratricopeptide (TPR) repeat protein
MYYKKYIFIFILFYCTLLDANNLDINIIKAMEQQRASKYNEAGAIYDNLYKQSLNDEFNLRAIMNYVLAEDFSKAKSRSLGYLQKHKNNIQLLLLVSEIYLIQQNLPKSKKYAQKALTLKRNNQSLDLMSKIYLKQKDYKNAYKYANESFIMSKNEYTLNRLLVVLLKYKYKKAIPILKEYINLHGLSESLTAKLLIFYKMDKNVEAMIDSYKKIYYKTKKIAYAKAAVELLLVNKKDEEAISFLVKNKIDDKYLFDVYKYSKKNIKAYKLAKRIFDKTRNYNYLAEYAIIKYEANSDKSKQLLKDIFTSLKLVNGKIDNPIYQNYFGYLLIDHDIDIENGIIWIKKALKSDPKSPYYLDSLAWGYYKQKKYKNAYNTIKTVVEDLKFKDSEVVKHWNKIKEKVNK